MSASLLAVVINIFVLVCLSVSFLKSKEKSLQGLRIAVKSFIRMMPYLIIIVLIIGIMQGFLSNDIITQYLGESSGFSGVLLAGITGAVLHIPALFSFPLIASLIESGASIMVAAAFITTLTMVGFVTLPFEIRVLGKKFAALRNLFSFLIALLIAVIMGVILG